MALRKNVPGAISFMTSLQPLVFNRLNLGAWYGFQEIVTRDKYPATKIEFKFRIENNSYLSFLYNMDTHNDYYKAIRLSRNSRYKSAFLTVRKGGAFVKKEILDTDGLIGKGWNSCRITLYGKGADIFLNNKLLCAHKSDILESQKIGFRGSLGNALVDDILIYHGRKDGVGSKEKIIFNESFDRRRHNINIMMLIFLLIISSNCVILYLRVKRKEKQKRIVNFILALNGSLLCITIIINMYALLYNVRYPAHLRHDLLKQGRYKKDRIKIKERHLGKYYKKKDPFLYRIMFIGSSQTNGAGASSEDNTLVRITQAYFSRKVPHLGRVECINAGINAIKAQDLFSLYSKKWIEMDPDMVVINLSTNDRKNTANFEQALIDFVELNKKMGIKTILCLEANSFEFTPGSLATHETMSKVAKQYDMPLIDMHNMLKSVDDTGFLWWDRCHLTDYGQAVVAKYLYNELLPYVEKGAKENVSVRFSGVVGGLGRSEK